MFIKRINIMSKKKILFFVESVSFAHYSRSLELARKLDSSQFDIVFATHPYFQYDVNTNNIVFEKIEGISPAFFNQCLKSGKPYFSKKLLDSYINSDLKMIEKHQPDLVVGDFHLSLNWSARRAKVPYANLTNAYWSPFLDKVNLIPEFFLFKILNEKLVTTLGLPILNFFTKQQLSIYNSVAPSEIQYQDFRQFLTDGDLVFHFDIPELFSNYNFPDHHHFLGHLKIAPLGTIPEWEGLDSNKDPLVFINLGSSGSGGKILNYLPKFKESPYRFVIAKANRQISPNIKVPSNVFIGDYLPGDQLCQMASMVVTNGGSPSTYQALAQGRPVLGISSNLDQHLFMKYLLKSFDIGHMERVETLNFNIFLKNIEKIISSEQKLDTAKLIKSKLDQVDSVSEFTKIILKTI
jgi:UDP:flavonoid glycosyltransferase YjiC (YdhE family)